MTPRFHYMLEEEAYPAIDGGAAADGALISRFLEHPAHEILSVYAKYRPSVDISVK